jgi:hypothetical protein
MYGALRCVFKLSGHNHAAGYAREECDFLDISGWITAISPCGLPLCTQPNACDTCGIAVGLTRHAVLSAYCISGCDYTAGIRNLGVVEAVKIVRDHTTINAACAALRAKKKRDGELKYHSCCGKNSVSMSRIGGCVACGDAQGGPAGDHQYMDAAGLFDPEKWAQPEGLRKPEHLYDAGASAKTT